MAARTLTACNQKGGVGKSTTSFHFGRAAVRRGMKVLAIDNDPQGNLTSSLSAEEVGEDQAGLADALSARAPEGLRDVIVPGIWPGLDLVPTSGVTLSYVRDELVLAGAGREGRLREALREVSDDYDLVLIDNAPSLDQLTINGLTAADQAIIVTESKQWSLSGMALLLETIANVRAYYNPHLAAGPVIVNRHDQRTVSGRTWMHELCTVAAERGLDVLTPVIPRKVVLADAVEAACGLDEWGTGDARALGTIYEGHLDTILASRP